MTTTTMRHHHQHHHHQQSYVAGPLRTMTRCTNTTRPNNTAKRKSAVELLQETKAFYVKSEVVLDRKQEFHPALRPSRSPEQNLPGGTVMPPKSPRSSHGNQLQDRLRMLLDVENMTGSNDSKSVFGVVGPYRRDSNRDVCVLHVQHKSLPDLHSSPGHSSTDSSESSYGLDSRSRSAYSSNTHKSQPEFGSLRLTKFSDVRRSTGRTKSDFIPDPRIYGSLRVTKSGEFISQRLSDGYNTQLYCWRRNSNTSSGNRSQHNSSSRHSQSADSGRLSQGGSVGLRTGRSGLPEPTSPPPQDTASDSGAEDGSPPHYSNDIVYKEKRRPIMRSKSDVTHKYCSGRPVLTLPPPLLMTPGQLELFFDHLGMDPVNYRNVCMSRSAASSPVFFSSVSSIDSCLEYPLWAAPEPERPTEPTSIVERNARIIKWLCNCRKAQMQELTLV